MKKAEEADGFIFGSPVYFSHPSGQLLSFLDRAFYSTSKNFVFGPFTGKPGAAVVVARRGGSVSALDQLVHYINYAQMVMPGSLYWPLAYGQKPGEVNQDEEGVQTIQVLAQSMAYVLKAMEAGKAQIPPPELPRKTYTNFIR